MHIRFDPTADALYVRLSDCPVAETVELSPGIQLDRDAQDRPVGIEVLGASKRPGLDPRSFAFDILSEETPAAERRS